MENDNPYQAPKSMENIEYQDIAENNNRFYYLRGRIGRLRYLKYVCVSLALLFALIILIAKCIEMSNNAFLHLILYLILAVGGLVAMIYLLIIYPIRRLNDVGGSGWSCLFLLIPVINIIYWFILVFTAGDKGANKYGNPPRPNRKIDYIITILLVICIFILPIIFSLSGFS